MNIAMPSRPLPAPFFKSAAFESHWVWVLCLVGLDYFSSLAYQPSIAFAAAGSAAPLATLVVIAATLLGAVPIYWYVASRSPQGQGGVAILERLLRGWRGKFLILVLLGFSATDFVMTKSLSVADAAEHVIRNPLPRWQALLDHLGAPEGVAQVVPSDSMRQRLVHFWNRQLLVTVLLLTLGFAFWALFRRGWTRRVLQFSVAIVGLYLALTGIVIGSGLYFLHQHRHYLRAWLDGLQGDEQLPISTFMRGHGWWSVAFLCLFAFPAMSLGLSGFELSMVAMPFLRGKRGDTRDGVRGRVHNTRKLLVLAAFVMALYLAGSTLVTTTLLAPEALLHSGPARDRALAYLAHGGELVDGQSSTALNPLFGPWFGSLYDLATILILCLAGASITMGLRELLPPFLNRLGMELDWAHRTGAILHLLNLVNLIVVLAFRANVNAQRGAYATSVLILMAGTAGSAALDRWSRNRGYWLWRMPWYFAAVAVAFGLAALGAAIHGLGGLLISVFFVAAILVSSFVSRLWRTMEMRFEGFEFKDDRSRFLWDSLVYLQFPILVPLRPGGERLSDREKQVRCKHRLGADEPLVFLEAELGDASDFYHRPLVEAVDEEGRFVIRISRCASIPHVIAAAALELSKVGRPPELHFGWSEESPFAANVNFLFFGQGNVPWMVRELIHRAEPNPGQRPDIIIG
jgi:hypothetical protein